MKEAPALATLSVESLISEVTDEFMDRLDRGERPEIEEYALRHPQIAAVLRQVLPALQVLRASPQDPAAPSASPASGQPTPGCLGDYRILGEVGRGGMGVVYEAEQISLARRVALKVLPFAAALDAKQLQRFKNEAQAAAQLHHQNIVPVYGVGCERSVHYYAMQFIDGQTLAALIHELRQSAGLQAADQAAAPSPALSLASELATGRWAPARRSPARGEELTGPWTPSPDAPGAPPGETATSPAAAISTEQSTRKPAFFRTVANLGVQAAEALEHAHGQGVMHRDIKPANLLVDLRGNLWITDFGLAHCQSQAGLTMTGDLVGTLRYMSPEQALAQRVVIDHRTDIYSLGVTLYELLTLEPVFDGQDRQELLRQIAFEEPRPPRRLNKAIPPELETITLKAMEKNPAERYATAEELARDLQRFLQDEPIRARRPSLWQKLRRWTRRHKPVVVTAAVAAVLGLVVAVAALALSNQRVTREQEQTEKALHAETAAKTDLAGALARERHTSYFHCIWQADFEWWANDAGRADQILDECPAEYRQWEWRYLKRLCHAEILDLRGHTGEVYAVAFSPDGRLLASAGKDQTIKIWDLATDQEVRTLPGRGDLVSSVAFSPDGRLLASANGYGEDFRPADVRIWEVTTGQEVCTCRGHASAVAGVSFSPDGLRLASAGWDGCVRVWDVLTGLEVRALKHPDAVKCVAFSPDGNRLVSGGHDRVVRIWDVTTGQAVLTLSGHESDVLGVAFSPDGKRLVSGGWDQTVRVWDAVTGRQVHTLRGHSAMVWGVAFSPDGQRSASGGGDGAVKMWEMGKAQELFTLRKHSRDVCGVAFSPGGRYLASASWDHTVKVWDLRTSQHSHSSFLSGIGQPKAAFSSDSRHFAVASPVPASWRMLGSARVTDLQTGRITLTLSGCLGGCNTVAFSPDDRRLATDWDTAVKLWDAQTGQELFTLTGHTGPVTCVAFSRDGQHLASASADQTVKVWDAPTGQRGEAPSLRLTLVGHAAAVTSVAFCADGRYLASASKDQTVKVWEVSSGREVHTLAGHGGPVSEVAFSPQGQRLASASDDQTVRIWDGASGQEIHTLAAHTDRVTGVAFSPDGQRLASCSVDGCVRVWDAATGQEALTFRHPLTSASCVAFSPDGQRLLAGGLLLNGRSYLNGGFGFVVWETAEPKLEDPATRAAALTPDAQNGWYLRGCAHSPPPRAREGGRGLYPCPGAGAE